MLYSQSNGTLRSKPGARADSNAPSAKGAPGSTNDGPFIEMTGTSALPMR